MWKIYSNPDPHGKTGRRHRYGGVDHITLVVRFWRGCLYVLGFTSFQTSSTKGRINADSSGFTSARKKLLVEIAQIVTVSELLDEFSEV
jgi:hypothetical protein